MKNETKQITREDLTPPPYKNIHKTFTAEVAPDSYDNGWPKGLVKIQKHNEDGSIETVLEYVRNYAFYKTFEPFQQFKNGKWTAYALISPEYSDYQVVNLETGEVVATRGYETVSQEDIDAFLKRTGKTEAPDWFYVGRQKEGFCPVEFRVFDWYEEFDEDAVNSSYTPHNSTTPQPLYSVDKLLQYTGQFALVAGCFWGDDSGWKLRYIDLSRLDEGIITEDERFGYVELAEELKSIILWSESGQLNVPVGVTMNLNTGKARRLDLNFEEDKDQQ